MQGPLFEQTRLDAWYDIRPAHVSRTSAPWCIYNWRGENLSVDYERILVDVAISVVHVNNVRTC